MTDAQNILSQAETALAENRIEDAELLASTLEMQGGRLTALLDLRARIAILRGDLDAAVALYTEALQLEPNHPGLFHSLARIYAVRQERELAVRAARSARQKGAPIELFARNLRIECTALYALGRQDEARALLATALKVIAERELMEGILRSKPDHGDLLASAMAAGNLKWVETLFRRMMEKDGLAVTQVGVFPMAILSAWCEKHGAAIHELDPVQSVSFAQCGTGSETRTYDTEPYLVASVPNAEFVCGWDIVIAPTGHVLEDSGYWGLRRAVAVSPHFTAYDAGLVAHDWPDEVHEVDAEALFLSSPESFQIGHWIVDFLPRLRAISGTDLKVAVPSTLPKKHRQFLALFGIGEDRIIGCELGRRYRFRKLVVAKTGDYFRPNFATIDFLRKHLMLDPAAKVQKGARVFVERTVDSRRIENREEFDRVLVEYDFQVIDLSKMSVAEQRASLAATETIMSVYGTNLTCSFFAPAGANVIELIWHGGVSPNIEAACNHAGINHQFVLGDEIIPEGKRWKKDRDLRVDCDLLRRRLAVIAAKNA